MHWTSIKIEAQVQCVNSSVRGVYELKIMLALKTCNSLLSWKLKIEAPTKDTTHWSNSNIFWSWTTRPSCLSTVLSNWTFFHKMISQLCCQIGPISRDIFLDILAMDHSIALIKSICIPITLLALLSSMVTFAQTEDTGRPSWFCKISNTKLTHKAANNGEIVSDHKFVKALLAFLIFT